jgi:3-hydroxyacyl-CoA dehydrogenase
VEAEKIRNAAIIGAGIMGQGIAQSFSQAGVNVKVVDLDQAKLDACRAQIKVNLELFQEFSLLKEDIKNIESRIGYFLMSDLKTVA